MSELPLNLPPLKRLLPSITSPQESVPLPILEGEPNRTFLDYDSVTAGRAVVMELRPPKFVGVAEIGRYLDKHDADDEDELGQRMGIWREGTPRQNAWKRFADQLDFSALGSAAQRLERAGINWRQAVEFEEIVNAASKLPPENSAN